jgi:2,3-bisphosphoglycerate-independent phosphoglycerate mutase
MEIDSIIQTNQSKIILAILDGLGGLPMEAGGPTELEAAETPNLDELARQGITGLHLPVAEGITPGSGPGHLGVFGYDPCTFMVGRGVLSAAGIGLDLKEGDVVARGNFCSVDAQGKVTDRRAGRIDTPACQRLCDKLQQIRVDDVEVAIYPEKEHRFVLRLSGDKLHEAVSDTDPQHTGVEPHAANARIPEAEHTAACVRDVVAQCREILRDETANMVLLRGFSSKPDWPSYWTRFGLRACASAQYPMYRGVARLLGMDVLDDTDSLKQCVQAIETHFEAYDFFFLHFKKTDSTGEDGDFFARTEAIAEFDRIVPRIMALKPDVLIVTGDHSTPAKMKSHSWHPVPVLLHSRNARTDPVDRFGERPCLTGALGPRFPAKELIPLALAHAGRLEKFGA